MRNTEERIERLHKRAKQLEARRERRFTALAVSFCLILFASLLGIIRQVAGQITDVTVNSVNSYAGASLLSSEAGGYVLVAVIAFMLGVVVTVLVRKHCKKD